MNKYQILGTGCPNCKRLEELVIQAADELGLEYEIEKVDKIEDILSFGVMITPALVINNKVVLAGKVPKLSEIKQICLDNNNKVIS